MVRISSFALFAALLVSAPEPSFAEAAPALNPHMPRQTMKPRFAHNNPKHIKRREFQNTTVTSASPQPQTTPVEVPTTHVPATQDDDSTTGGFLGLSVDLPTSLGDGATVAVSAGPIQITAGVPGLADGPSTSANAQSQQQQSFTSRSADLLSSATDGSSSTNPIPIVGGQSSSNSANAASSSGPAATQSANGGTPSSQAATQSGDGANTNTAQAATTAPAQSNAPDPLASIGNGVSSLVNEVSSFAGSVASAAGSAVTAIETGAAGIFTDTPIISLPTPTLTQPTDTPVNTQPTDTPTLTQPTDTPINTQPTDTPINTQPTITPIITLPTITPIITLPTITPIITLPTDTPIITLPTDTPIITLPTDTPIVTLPTDTPIITLPTDTPIVTLPTDTPIVTLPTDTPTLTQPTDTPTVSVPVSVPTDTPSQSPITPTESQPSATQTPSQPTGPITQTVIPVPVSSAPTDSQLPSSATQSPSTPTASALTQSASASPQTQSAAPSSAATASEPQSQSLSAQPASTEQPQSSLITAAPTGPTSTPPAPTSIAATGTDTQTQIYIPTSLVLDPQTMTSFSPPASTAAFSSNGIPSTMPHVIPPPGSGGVLPPQPLNSTLIQIGFQYQLNYPFVLAHSSAIYQIFDILPWGLAFGLDIDHSNITMQSLQPYDTSRTQGFITTVALAYIPSDSVTNLTVSVPNPGAMLYKNTNDTRHALMSVIDPNFPVLAGSGMNIGDGTTGSNPASTSVIADQNPLDNNAQAATGVNGTAVGIGVGVCAGAAVYGAAMFFIAKRYKQRKARHSRSSSMIDTASMVNSSHEEQTGAGTALMSNGPDGSYGTRGGSRNSNGSGGSSRGRGEISAPVMAENSLGWN